MVKISNSGVSHLIENSEIGRILIREKLVEKDIWDVAEIGFSEVEAAVKNSKHIYFDKIELPWLASLAKATVLSKRIQKHSLSSTLPVAAVLRYLSEFLIGQGFSELNDLNDAVLKKFIFSRNTGSLSRINVINYSLNLWKEEEWFNCNYIPPKISIKQPELQIIPEEVLLQIYENLCLFPNPLERLFRLQMALGIRIGEAIRMPRHCLKKEGESWFLQRYIEKRKQYVFKVVHPLVAEIVKAQQVFLTERLGAESEFNYLFSKLSIATHQGCKYYTRNGSKRFTVEPIYTPEILSVQMIFGWLDAFSEKVDLRDKYNNPFQLKSHMFRRTKASIMSYCDTEDEYIAAVLGHSSLDMLPHYRDRSLDKIEKNPINKGFVDKYGRVTRIKPKKTRYENLAEVMKDKSNQLKVTTPLGECHRPSMLGDCQKRYACLSCDHHRVTLEDQEKLTQDKQSLIKDRQHAIEYSQIRKANEINNLIEMIDNRLSGLSRLEEA